MTTTLISRAYRTAMTAAIGLLLVAATVACGAKGHTTSGTSGEDVVRTIDIITRDFGFDMGPPARIGAGEVTVRLRNAGGESHQVELARLRPGATIEAFHSALRSGDSKAAVSLIDFAGGSNTVGPGGTQETTVDLLAGDYLAVCFVPSPDGTPHLAKGMVMPFSVVAAKGGAVVPPAVAEVRLRDYGFSLPAAFGHGTYKVVNDGPQPHELAIVRLADGKTPADAGAFFASGGHGPPPFVPAGGVGAVTVGASAYGRLDLPPGNYLALCYVPDGSTGVPHLAMGMVQPFSVS
jgi:hypothetical protein